MGRSTPLCALAQEFEAFASKNAGVFEAAGTTREDALTKMRLMALLGLGVHPAPVSFSDVQVSTVPRIKTTIGAPLVTLQQRLRDAALVSSCPRGCAC